MRFYSDWMYYMNGGKPSHDIIFRTGFVALIGFLLTFVIGIVGVIVTKKALFIGISIAAAVLLVLLHVLVKICMDKYDE